MSHIQPVVLTIIKKEGKILLTLRNDADPEDAPFHNVWQIPGGGIEFAETPEETAAREAREELGIEIEIERMVPRIFTSVRGNWQGLLIAYVCRMTYPDSPIVINEEASDYRWVSLDEIRDMELTPFTRLLIDHALLD
jgi:8-oxo-dGTP diphosphatase